MEWFLAKLKIDKKAVEGNDYGDVANSKLIAAVMKKADTLSEVEIAQLLLEYYLVKMMFQGDIKDYKIKTTEALSWLGIGINIIKPNTC